MTSAFSHTCCSQSTSTYSNPVINQDFPDPNCIKVADTFFVLATNFGGSLFVLYFVAWDTLSDRQAIGVAISKNPEGPYQSHAPAPVIIQASKAANGSCKAATPADQGGSIDPSVFTDSDGKRWLLFKNDGNAVDKPTHIYLRPLSPDALQFAGKEQLLIQDDQHWEGKVVEAPFMWKHAGRYYLFYSGNGYNSPEYAVGYAVADHITGPFHKHPQPVLKSDGAVAMLGTNQLPTGTCKFANWQV
ncbi:hypothetical protein WJX79_008399 [Trebouxia sp. C0005]